MDKLTALAKFLDIDKDEIKETKYCFEEGKREYLVLTDKEADEKAKEYIIDTLWAFNKSFLDEHSKVISEIDEKTWLAIVEKCESSNNAVKAMLGDNLEDMIKDAIRCDGRGHFLSSYDGEENEEGEYYIYRIN